MAMFKRMFHRKQPDHLLEISDRVFVFDCCISNDAMESNEYKTYIDPIVHQLQDYYSDSDFMVFNFKQSSDKKTYISHALLKFKIKVTEYPWQYDGCHMLPLEIFNNILQSCESWLSLSGQENVLLMHCERGGWPVLAFMLNGLLLFRKHLTREQKTLEMIYKQASLSLLNTQLSQLRLPNDDKIFNNPVEIDHLEEDPTNLLEDNISDWVFVESPSHPATPPPPPPPPPPPLLPPPVHGAPPRLGGHIHGKTHRYPSLNKGLSLTLWEELQRQSLPDVDISENEILFSASSKHDIVQLIDLRRANNTEIMLSKVKMSLPDMVEAVLAMDDELLDVNQVENILNFFPTKKEMEQLTNYTGDLEKLGKCEHFILELMKVPRMEAKLNTFLFKIQFTSKLADLRRSLDIINSACEEVRNSVKFKDIMKRILYLGNTLNQGIARGSAVGFKLDNLMKLTDMTLMHYLCKCCYIKTPTLLEFPWDLVNLEAASKIQLKNLAEEMQVLNLGLRKSKQELDACANDGNVSKYFPAKLKMFIAHADSEMEEVTSFYSSVGKRADGLALYFGEDPKRCPFEQAIQTILNFVRLFEQCHKENLEQVESLEGDENGVVFPPPNAPQTVL